MSANEREARNAAADFRRQHGLGLAPLEDLVALIEMTQRVDVAILAVDSENEHGMTAWDQERDAIFVAAVTTPQPFRQRFTLAHELGHILFGDFKTPDNRGWSERTSEEKRADEFARNLLVPLEALALLKGGRFLGLEDLSDLVQRFQTSPQVVAIQAHAAGLISSQEKESWMVNTAPRLAARFGWSEQYEAMQADSRSHRAPQRLLARAISGYEQGTVQLPYIARLRGMTVAEVAAEFAEQEISPRPRTRVRAKGLSDLRRRPSRPTHSRVDFSALDSEMAEETPSRDNALDPGDEGREA